MKPKLMCRLGRARWRAYLMWPVYVMELRDAGAGHRPLSRRLDPSLVVDRAKSFIRVQAYGFTSLPIIHALQRAAGRDVEVLMILDKTNERKYSGATLLEAAGCPWLRNSIPALSRARWTACTFAARPEMPAEPDASMLRIVFTCTFAVLAKRKSKTRR